MGSTFGSRHSSGNVGRMGEQERNPAAQQVSRTLPSAMQPAMQPPVVCLSYLKLDEIRARGETQSTSCPSRGPPDWFLASTPSSLAAHVTPALGPPQRPRAQTHTQTHN